MFKFDYDDGYSGYNEHKDSLPMVRRFNFLDMAKGIIAFNGVRVVFGATLSSALVASALGIMYILPTFFFFLFGAKLLTRIIFALIYKVVPRTKENRWTMNSIAMSFWTLPLSLMLPGAVYLFTVLFLIIPYGVVSILFLGKSAEDAFLLHSVIASINIDDNTFTLASIAQRILWWDAAYQSSAASRSLVASSLLTSSTTVTKTLRSKSSLLPTPTVN